MRNRQLIARWAYEHGKADDVVEFAKRDGKTYVVINDYENYGVCSVNYWPKYNG